MENKGVEADILGKKVFFLYPSAVVQNRIVPELIQFEHEVYVAKDPDALKRYLKQHPDSIVFIDIDQGMSEKDWEGWVFGMKGAPEYQNVLIGIVSSNSDEEIKKKYVNAIKVHLGFVEIRADLNVVIEKVNGILTAINDKCRRKYLRATIEQEANTTINVPQFGTYITGRIKDVSAVGLSCTFEQDPELTKNSLVKDVQVKLQGMLLKVEGIVFGSRMDGPEKIYVLLFSQKVDPETRSRIRKYIQQNLQSKMDVALKKA